MKFVLKLMLSIIPFGIISTAFSISCKDQNIEDITFKEGIPAFTGAEGFGRYAKGGRGGDVYFVTNINDSGNGSLRNGIETATGPRTILFEVSGIIALKSDLRINKPNLTIAGQTAPGDGICIRNYSLQIINTHDIIIRHIRIRPGDEIGRKLIEQGASGWESDALWIGNSKNVIIDHCSTGWATDENLSSSQAELDNISVQWTLITESLNNSTHHKGKHGFGSIIAGYSGDKQPKVTMYCNLYAHNWGRNPNFDGSKDGTPPGPVIDFRNNVIYDWGFRAAHSYGKVYYSVNFVNNYYKPGSSTLEEQRKINFTTGGKEAHIYTSGNHLTSLPEADSNNWSQVDTRYGVTVLNNPLQTMQVTTYDAMTAYDKVLEYAGAFPRDAVDERVVGQVRNGTGRIIDSALEVGGWPTYNSTVPPADTDRDGIPDMWETEFGLNPMNPSDRNYDRNGDGYTNLEEYLNWKHEQVIKEK